MATDPYANLWQTQDLTFTEGDESTGAGLSDYVLTSSSVQTSALQQGQPSGPTAQAPAASGGGGMAGATNPVSAAVAAVGKFMGGLGIERAASAQMGQLRAAAANLYTEAAQTMRQGEYVAMTRGLDLEQRLGSLKTAVAASGVDSSSGSIQAARNMTETFGRLDVQMERLNASRRAKGLRAQARQYEEQAAEIEEQTPFNIAASMIG